MREPLLDANADRRWSGWSALALTSGGLGAAFAAAACCALPMLLGALGIGSAWLFGIATLAAPHRMSLILVAGMLLAAGAGMLTYRFRTDCTSSGCDRPVVRRLTALGLGVGLVFAILGYRYA